MHSTGEPVTALDREKVARAGVARRVAQLAHRSRFDLADALTGEVEVLADFFERAGLAAVQTEQALQRLLISERAGILRARAQLLRALGGSWTEELQDPMAAAAPPETPQAASTLGPR